MLGWVPFCLSRIAKVLKALRRSRDPPHSPLCGTLAQATGLLQAEVEILARKAAGCRWAEPNSDTVL